MNNKKLEKLLGMLGSEFDGERASAALLISNMAKKAKLTIVQMIEQEARPQVSTTGPTKATYWKDVTPPRYRDITVGLELIMPAIHRKGTPWERNFANDILARYEFNDELSKKQIATIEKLMEKYLEV